MSVNIHEAKTHFSKVLDRVAHGEDVVISRSGVPIAVVVSIARYQPKREFGFVQGTFKLASLDEFNAPLDANTLQYFTDEID